MNLSQRLADCRAHGPACLRRAHGPPLAMPQRQMAAKGIGCCGGRLTPGGERGGGLRLPGREPWGNLGMRATATAHGCHGGTASRGGHGPRLRIYITFYKKGRIVGRNGPCCNPRRAVPQRETGRIARQKPPCPDGTLQTRQLANGRDGFRKVKNILQPRARPRPGRPAAVGQSGAHALASQLHSSAVSNGERRS